MRKRYDDAIDGVISVLVSSRTFLSGKVAYRVLVSAVFLSFLVAGRSLGLNLNSIVWHWVLLSAALTAPLLVCNAGEYWLIAKTHGLSLSFSHCIRVTLLGSVANLLPIPGQSATRVADLGSHKVALSSATNSTLAAGALWSGWLFIIAGVATLGGNNLLFSGVLLVLGAACCATAVTQVRDRRARTLWLLAGSAIELLTVLIAWWRLSLSFEALGIQYTFSSAAVLLSANVVAAIVGVAPAGLGIREGAAAIIAPMVNIEPLAAAVSIAFSRFVGMAVCASLALVALRTR